MHKYRYLALSLTISFIFACLVWQMAEAKLVDFFSKACYAISKRSFTELNTHDKNGMPMRYYPGVGTFYDPELIAREASRFYDTRIDPVRLKGFIAYSDWLIAHSDSNGIIAQPNDFSPAELFSPWYSGSAQTANLLAIAKRAGYERDVSLLSRSRNLMNQIGSQNSPLQSSIMAKDGSLWIQSHPGRDNELRGMLSGLADLAAYAKLTRDSSATELFNQGVTNLSKRLPQLEKQAYLDDKFCRMGRRDEHSYLTKLLQDVSSATPDSVFKPAVQRFEAKDRVFVLAQMLKRPRPGRISGFLVVWLGSFAIAHAFLRAPKKNLTINSGS